MDAAAVNWTQAMALEEMVREEKKTRALKQALNCPRCNSSNTKFCYYNNYSLSQPRYLCKTCRRYWTEGGSLRNIPVGGGSRKNKKSSSSRITDHRHPNPSTKKQHPGPQAAAATRDLNLGISAAVYSKPESPPPSSMMGYSALPLVDPGLGFHCLPEFMKPSSASLSFSLDGGYGGGSFEEANLKPLVFPFEDLKQVTNHGAGDWTW